MSATDAEPPCSRPGTSAGARVRRHALFICALLAATALRAVTVLAYRGVLWFPDSHSYLGVAVRPAPYPARPQGYAFFLRVLEPAHSYIFVAIVQHLLVLAAATAMYLLMRRRFAVPQWAATLASLPVLFDAYQVQLEHMLLSDTLFEVLAIAAVVAALWKPRPGWVLCAVAGLAIGGCTVSRSVGLPLIAVIVVVLLIQRVGVRALGAAALGCAVPLAAYAVWFHAYWGVYGFSNSSGLFLYGRTAVFADCAKIDPPDSERFLCPRGPVSARASSPDYIWNVPPLSEIGTWRKFTPRMSALTGDFAKRAIKAQPADYLRTVAVDFAHTFEWNRHGYPTAASMRAYEFPEHVKPLKPDVSVPGATILADSRTYAHADGGTPVVDPYAAYIRAYQHHVRLPGTLLGVILATALTGIILLWRRLGGGALLPWTAAMVMLLVPPVTSGFGYRYILPAAPLACLAAAIALTEVRNARRRPADD